MRDEGVVLRTDRLILRPHILGDFEDSFDMWSDPTTTEFIGGHPSTREECWSRFLRYVGMWPILGFGYWAIMERDTQTFVGEIGCAEFKRDIVPPISLPESGWAITRRARGKGYAEEALRAALDWTDESLKIDGTTCIIAADNRVSRRLAEKVGYKCVGSAVYKGNPLDVFTRKLGTLVPKKAN